MERDLVHHLEHRDLDVQVLAEIKHIIEQSQTRRARFHQLERLQPKIASRLTSSLQNCLTLCQLGAQLRSIVFELLLDICDATGELPESYWLSGFSRGRRIAAGGDSTIYEGVIATNGRAIIVRDFHPPSGGEWGSTSGRNILKLIKREVITHWQLKHCNVAQLLGFELHVDYGTPGIIMSREKYPSVLSYLKERSVADHFMSLVLGICDGLLYLHTNSPLVIHGDLHPRNIAVNEHGAAVLCNFGYLDVRHELTRTHEIRPDVRLRFVAPELDLGFENFKATTHSDVYSFAMVMYSLATLGPPFVGRSDWSAAEAARLGERPGRLGTGQFDVVVSQRLWQLVTEMWCHDPSARPAIDQVKQRLTNSCTPSPGVSEDSRPLATTHVSEPTGTLGPKEAEVPLPPSPVFPLRSVSEPPLAQLKRSPSWSPGESRKYRLPQLESSLVSANTLTVPLSNDHLLTSQRLSGQRRSFEIDLIARRRPIDGSASVH